MHDQRGFRDPAEPSRRSRTALVVLNERARGTSVSAVAEAIRVLRQGYDVRVAAPRTREALQELVAGAAEELVIAVGGDGTVNAVATVLPPAASLGILPTGTANDLAREVGIAPDPVAAAARLVAGRDDAPRLADLVAANGQRFCTVGGIGLVARVTSAVAAAKARPGLRHFAAQLLGGGVYKVSTTATLLAARGLVRTVEIRYRDAAGSIVDWRGDVHALFIVNHRRCGGGLSLPTDSRGDDGLFELGMVTAGSRAALVLNFARLAAGAPIGERAFVVRRATEATIRLAAPTPFAADGELLAEAAEYRVTMHPGALRLAGVPREG